MSVNSAKKTTIVLATGNQGKVKELSSLLENLPVTIVPQSDFNLDEVAETGTTFIENAIIKARYAAEKTGFAAIADDSGLAVDALNGAPGIYSARYAGENANDQANNQKLLSALENTKETQRTARFHCVLVYMQNADDPTPLVCHGVWEGFITKAPQGDMGFGYDPLFYVPQYKATSAQLARKLKNTISHRAQALKLLLPLLTEKLSARLA